MISHSLYHTYSTQSETNNEKYQVIKSWEQKRTKKHDLHDDQWNIQFNIFFFTVIIKAKYYGEKNLQNKKHWHVKMLTVTS